MPKSVDTRVVQMQFDNRQFEKNISQTIASLEQLDESLQFKNATKGFDKISEAAKETDMSALGSAVDTVKVKFSALEAVAFSVLNNITNKAINAGERIVKSLTIDNVTEGWRKFEEITNNSAILVNQGNAMEDVEDTLNELKFVADETSYSITNLTDVMSKFAAKPGFTMERAKQVAEGIALLAASAGQNAVVASRASLQLAQVSGYVKAQDWMSIRTSNMDTAQFKKVLADYAVLNGTLKEVDGNYKTLKGHIMSLDALFTEGLQDQWLTLENLADGLSSYSESIQAVQDRVEEYGGTASRAIADLLSRMDESGEYVDEFGNHVTKFSLLAFQMGQEARTWTDVVNSLKDAISSQWANIYTSIFGNYEEAKQLFTGLINILNELFVGGMYELADVFSWWKDAGGRDTLLDAMSATLFTIKDTIDSIKEAWNSVFYPIERAFNTITGDLIEVDEYGNRIEQRGKKLLSFTERIRRAVYKVYTVVEANQENIQKFVVGLANVWSFIKDLLSGVIKALTPARLESVSLLNIIFNILGVIGNILTGTIQWIRQANVLNIIFNVIANTVTIIGSALLLVVGIVLKVFSGIATVFNSIINSQAFQFVLNGLVIGFNALIGVVFLAYDAITSFIMIITDPSTYQNSDNAIVKALANIAAFFINIYNNIITSIAGIKEFFSSLSGMSLIEKIRAIGNKIFEVLQNIFNGIWSKLEGILGPNNPLLTGIKALQTALSEWFHTLDIGVVTAMAFATTIVAVGISLFRTLNSFTSLAYTVEEFVDLLKGYVRSRTWASVLINFARAFAVVAASLYILAKYTDTEKLKAVADVIREIIWSIALSYLLIDAVSKVLTLIPTANKVKMFENVGPVLLSLTIGILAIAGALKLLNEFKMSNDIIAGLTTALIAVGLLGAIAVAVSFFSSRNSFKGLSATITILAVASSLKKIVEAMKEIGSINSYQTISRLKLLLPVFVAFGALCIAAGQVRMSSVIGLLLFLKVMNDIIPMFDNATKELATVKVQEAADSIAKILDLTNVLNIVVIMLSVMALRGKQIGQATKGIAFMLIAIAGMITYLGWLGKKEFKVPMNVVILFNSLAEFVLKLEALSIFTQKSKMLSFSLGLLLLTGAIALLALIAKEIDSLKITEDAIYQLKMIMDAIALLVLASIGTSFSKPMSLLAIFIGLYGILSFLMSLTLLNEEQMKKLERSIMALSEVVFAIGFLFFALTAKGLTSKKEEAEETVKGFGKIGKAIANALSSVASFFGKIIMLGAVIASVYAVFRILKEMQEFPHPEQLAEEAIAIVAGMAGIIGAVWVLQKSFKGMNGKEIASSLIGSAFAIVEALGILAGVWLIVEQLKGIQNSEAFWTEIKAIMLLVGEVILGIILIGNFIEKDNIGAVLASFLPLIALGGTIWLMANALSQLTDFEWDKIKNAVYSFGVAIVAAVAATYILSSLGEKGAIGGAVVAGVLLSLAWALSIVADSMLKFAEAAERLNNATITAPAISVIKSFVDASKDLISNGNEYIDSMEQVGKYAVEGFCDGIAHNIDLPFNAAFIMARASYDGARAGLQEKSPSKLMYIIGSFAVQGLANALTDGKNSVFASGEEVGSQVVDGTNSKISALSDSGTKSADAYADSFQSEMTKKMPGITATIEGTFIGQLISKFASGGSESGGGFLSKLFGGNKKDVDGTSDQINEIYNTITNLKNTDFESIVSPIFGKIKEWASPLIEDAKTFFKTNFGDIWNDVTSQFGGIEDQFGSAYEQFKKDFAGMQQEIEKTTTDFNNMASSASNAKSRLESLKDTIKSQIDIFSKFNEQVEMVEDEVYDPETNTTSLVQREKTGEEMAAEMLANMESQIFGVTEWSNNMARLAMMGLDQGLLEELGALGPQGAAKVKAFVSMTDEQLQRANYLYATSTKLPDYAANEVEASYKYAGEMAVKGFSNALDNYKGIMTASNEEALGIVADYTPKIYKAFKKAGNEASRGAKDGIDEKADLPISAAERLAKSSIKKFKEVCAIASPSKVFKTLGSFLDEGLAIGITDGESGVLDSISSLASSVIDSTTRLFDSDNTITLTPILDLSEIQNGAGELSSTFGNAQVGIASAAFNAKIAADHEIVNAQIQSTRVLAAAMQSNTDRVVEAIVNSDTPVNVNLTLQGDSAQLFKLVRQENAKFTKINGYNALAY